MKVEPMTKEKLRAALQETANSLRKELAEEFKKIGDPVDGVKMNKNDGTGDSDKALVFKDKTSKEEKSGKKSTDDPIDIKLNSEPSKGGSDEKVATAVSVKAGAEKGGKGVTAGQHKANFDSKTSGPKTSTGEPFDKKAKESMNEMDKEVDEGTKTYVEAGSEKGGTTVDAGKHDANWKESAPKSDNDKRIASGIQLSEQLKEKYTPAELRAYIISEGRKLAKKNMLEAELLKIKQQMDNL